MNKYKSRLVCLLTFAAAVANAQANNWDALKGGVVQVRADGSFGEGIVAMVSPKSIQILTAAHLVKTAKSVTISFDSEKDRAYVAQVLSGVSERLDLAVVEVLPVDGHLPVGLPSFEIRENASLQPAEAISLLDGKWAAVAGTVTSLTHDGDSRRVEYSGGAVGLPGGPLFDNEGRVMAIHLASKEGEKYAVGVKIESSISAMAALDHAMPNLHRFILDGNWRFRADSPQGFIPDVLPILIRGSSFVVDMPKSHIRMEGECSYDGRQLGLTLTSVAATESDSSADQSADMSLMYKTLMDEFNSVLFKEKLTRQPDGSFTGASSAGVMAGATLRLVRSNEQ